ncbi:YtxH domain-containing protein [Pedobacter africanus]|uniref:YtxH-like protein n=1 Tax=Pedobacter africanus TaxID=151894 RepID=A0A1W1ZEH0_9SPHI|nr:YtxH domain-containing protein [Pedobacter africanus]SMC46804.1 YtxH-like protein [Pedobacter africanus]
MKTKKIIESLLTPRSSDKTKAITLLIGGLAVGAAIGVLFATEKGKLMRQKICDTVNNLFDHQETDDCAEPVSNQKDQNAGKKPKSDIKSIIHNAHAATAHTEQSLS